ncbi:MAG: 2'-5' RNA ligase family protein [Saprospiraceae bacterium]|nr:2'-5' RNA ligase family protein [Saprospiraceae bacterium]
MSKQTDLFFIAVLPPAEIQEEVTAFKEYAATEFNSKHALRSPPHITLIPPFRWASSERDKLIRFLEGFTFSPSTIALTLENFDCFAPRVIFVDVNAELLLQQMQVQLKTEIAQHLGIEHKGPFGFHPHMTIAFRDLVEDVFQTAWAYFSTQSYLRTFAVQELTLLKHHQKGWQVDGSFLFAE